MNAINMDFFFSSRRRHTRWNCDWSSDVCSSDLIALGFADGGLDEAWAEDRDLHLASRQRQFGEQRLRHGDHGMLGGVVDAEIRTRQQPGHRRCVDDVPFAALPQQYGDEYADAVN